MEKDASVRQLDAKAGQQIVVTSEDVKDAEKLARMLQTALRAIDERDREWRPRRLYFRDLTVDATGTTKYRLTHNFGGRVNFYFADTSSTGYADLRKDSETSNDTLVLTSYNAATVTVVVEEAG